MRWIGFLEHGDEKIIVTEYVNNGTLRDHLAGKSLSFLTEICAVYRLFYNAAMKYIIFIINCYIIAYK